MTNLLENKKRQFDLSQLNLSVSAEKQSQLLIYTYYKNGIKRITSW